MACLSVKMAETYHYLDGYPKLQGWFHWGQRSVFMCQHRSALSICLQLPGTEGLRDFPVDEELGKIDPPWLRQRRAVSPTIPQFLQDLAKSKAWSSFPQWLVSPQSRSVPHLSSLETLGSPYHGKLSPVNILNAVFSRSWKSFESQFSVACKM